MLLLIFYAFLAGIITILSPCILPVLPIVLSTSIDTKNIFKKQLGIISGFIASFTFFTLFLSSIVFATDISPNTLRYFSIVVIALLGLSLLSNKTQAIFEKLFSGLANKVPQFQGQGSGYWTGFLIGLSLGLIWTPCVGPILASVITLALTGTVTLNAFFITFAYALGTAIPMFAVMLGGKKVISGIPALARNSGTLQKIFGVLTIFITLAIYKNWDRNFQTFILTKFPGYGTSITKIEEKGDLSVLTGVESQKKTAKNLPIIKKAPEIISVGQWFNIPEEQSSLSIQSLKGKVVLVDFWTYTCINCIRTFPYLADWHNKYKDDGLVIIGVHAPEFEFEKDPENVAKALLDFNILYPVVQDNSFTTWRAYQNQYWPAKYLIDKEGNLRYFHFGEGDYDETEMAIQTLLSETGKQVTEEIKNPNYQNYAKTPEIYLGYGRGDVGLFSKKDSYQQMSFPKNLIKNQVAYQGQWLFSEEFAQSETNSELELNFESKDVFLVMSPVENSAEVEVYVDEVLVKKVTVDQNKLYELTKLSVPGRHTLRLKFPGEKVKLFAFTFG